MENPQLPDPVEEPTQRCQGGTEPEGRLTDPCLSSGIDLRSSILVPLLPSQVRFSSLLMLMELTSKLKENYMLLLPETIPFLAELMEGKDTHTHVHAHTPGHPGEEKCWSCQRTTG